MVNPPPNRRAPRCHRCRTRPIGWWLLLIGLLLVVSCGPKPTLVEPPLVRLAPAEFPLFDDRDGYAGLDHAIAMSLTYLRKLPPDRPVTFGEDTYPVAHLIHSLEAFAALIADHPSAASLQQAVVDRFRVYRAAGRGDERQVLFTGYYEPVLPGRLVPGDGFHVPVHSRPRDLLEIDLSLFDPELKGRRIVGRLEGRAVVPYPDRAAIVRAPDFHRQAPPVAWVADEVDLFMMMVQGSGRIALEDGSQRHLQFDGSNGRPYRSIGRLLIDQGHIAPDEMSMQAIRRHLRRHPEQVRAVLDYNPRYIFFRPIAQGPIGALGVPLTPKRSLAVDRRLFPLAALAFIDLPVPQVSEGGAIAHWGTHHGFVLAQDTGSAITGPGRADLFWGGGAAAETAAGHLRHPGRLFFLVLAPEAAQ